MNNGTLILIISLIIPHVIAAIIIQNVRSKNRQRAEEKKKVDEARAKSVTQNAGIRSVKVSTQGGNESQKLVYLKLEILSDPPYEANTVWLVNNDQIGNLKEGSNISVLISKQYPDKIYPPENWAEYPKGY